MVSLSDYIIHQLQPDIFNYIFSRKLTLLDQHSVLLLLQTGCLHGGLVCIVDTLQPLTIRLYEIFVTSTRILIFQIKQNAFHLMAVVSGGNPTL